VYYQIRYFGARLAPVGPGGDEEG
jgi:hypothetical protein